MDRLAFRSGASGENRLSEASINLRIHISGIVQGVGFRPAVYALAVKHSLKGWVINSSHGVEIEVSGSQAALDAFVEDLKSHPPRQARVESFEVRPSPSTEYDSFRILESHNEASDFLPIASDLAICEDCKRELFDPSDRRYRYPFINCTNCGPRYSIIKSIPYDRLNTTMAGFPLCADCEREYIDPADRRFHAQPIACPVCGPKVWLETSGGERTQGEAAIQAARELIKAGKILAVKGLGGFHLFCNAGDAAAVERLRERKHRTGKPFALMAFDLLSAEPYFNCSSDEAALLESEAAPIVLLEPSALGEAIRSIVAPDQSRLGLMLAYTPLHALLLEPASDLPALVVATSGNLAEEPICYTQEEAILKLSTVADAFLMHDRPIHHAIDDSLTQIVSLDSPKPYPIRRARGLNTQPIRIPNGPQTLGFGAELKNTFCLARQGHAFLSHHMGDLQNQETFSAYEAAIAHDRSLYRIDPELLAADLHPDYLSTKYAKAFADKHGLSLIQVQHHHAHLAACMSENQLDPEENVIGLIFDGTGYGLDGSIWGGEILLGNCQGFERAYHLTPVPQPGGDAAVKEPAKMALSYLLAAGLEDDLDQSAPAAYLGEEKISMIKAQIKAGINAPLTSSMGRLFDAVSALLGRYHQVSYEAQAAIALESLTLKDSKDFYMVPFSGSTIDQMPLIRSLMADLSAGLPQPFIATKFHNALTQLALELSDALRARTGVSKVVISGGVWQNLYLLEHTWGILKSAGFEVYTHKTVPTNDACIALGQVAVALASGRR